LICRGHLPQLLLGEKAARNALVSGILRIFRHAAMPAFVVAMVRMRRTRVSTAATPALILAQAVA
jgi:hypothetical protein